MTSWALIFADIQELPSSSLPSLAVTCYKTDMNDRRHFLHFLASTALAAPLGSMFSPGAAFGQSTAASAPAPALTPLNRFPTTMQQWLTREMIKAEEIGNARRDALKTKADAQRYVETCKLFIRECFGLMPEKTPLNA